MYIYIGLMFENKKCDDSIWENKMKMKLKI